MNTSTHIRIFGAAPDSIVDGPGLRYAVFTQGCSHGCPGCHNEESQPFEGGTLCLIDDLIADIQSNGLVHEVTLSGGEPFEQAEACAKLAQRLKALGYGIWTYTGYLYEDLCAIAQEQTVGDASAIAQKQNSAPKTEEAPAHKPETMPTSKLNHKIQAPILNPEAVRALLDATDVLVDGPFIESLKSLGLQWKGSSNQRLIDIAKTRATGHIVQWRSYQEIPTKPPSW